MTEWMPHSVHFQPTTQRGPKHPVMTGKAVSLRACGLVKGQTFVQQSVAARGVTNSWLRQNRISEYGEYGKKWVIFVFSK